MKNYKKGFTLVELLIVIAILAILATVVVVSYVSYIDKANQSVDQQLVTQMNNVLQADEILNEKPATVVDAKNILIASRLDDFTPIDEKNVFYWVGTENRVILWSKDEVDGATGRVTYPEDYVEKFADYTEPSVDWADLGYDYAVVNVNAEDGKTLIEALFAALEEASTTEPTYLVLPENSELIFSQNDLLAFTNNLKSDSGVGKYISINLNGSTISIPDSEYGVDIPDGGTLELTNGTWDFVNTSWDDSGFQIGVGSSLVLRGMNVEMQAHTGIAPLDTASEVIIEDSSILTDAYFGLMTNGMTSSHVRIVVNNSEIKNIVNGGGVGFMVNCTANVHIENSHIAGSCHALAMRAGHVEVIDTTLETIATEGGIFYHQNFTHFPKKPKTNGNYITQTEIYSWADGNKLPGGVLVLGDYARETESYPGDVDAELVNVTFKTANETEVPKCLVAAKLTKNVTLTYDNNCDIGTPVMYAHMISEYFGSIVINGESKTLN